MKSIMSQVETDRLYELPEAVTLVKSCATAKFDETVELALRLHIDPKRADQIVRGTLTLPHGIGKQKRILVFAQGDKMREAQAAGADFVGGNELVEKIAGGWLDFDLVLATPDMMKVVARLGKILGPRGLMPSPKSGTVTEDVGEAVREFKGGKLSYKNDAQGNIHLPVGKASFSDEALIENIQSALNTILRARPPAVKGQYILSITLSSTMGPGIRLNPARLGK
ncbi:MAG: 50S ribosomal protein L1 [bacterium JZ-2024 1]